MLPKSPFVLLLLFWFPGRPEVRTDLVHGMFETVEACEARAVEAGAALRKLHGDRVEWRSVCVTADELQRD